MTTDDQDIPIENEIARVDAWRPYDFLSLVESEMSLRGREYQVMDLQADLGALKSCLTYAERCRRSKYDVVRFLIWALDGTTEPTLTSLKFLPGVLRGFFGNAPERAKSPARERRDIPLSGPMRAWLDELKAGNPPDLGLGI